MSRSTPRLLAYIDGSGSTQTQGFSFRNLGAAALDAGWETFEFSTEVRPFKIGQQPFFEGTHLGRLTEHIQFWRTRYMQEDGIPPKIIVLTDEDTDDRSWNEIRRLGAAVFRVTSQLDSYVTALKHLNGNDDRRSFFDSPKMQAILDNARIFDSPNMQALLDYTNPSRPQEAPMSTKPTIVTSVTLARVTGREQVVIGDLKNLITEVERVGGNDDSTVDLSNDARTWNVTLSVKANEIEREVEVTDEERIALLDEAKTASKARKAEIKTLLGL